MGDADPGNARGWLFNGLRVRRSGVEVSGWSGLGVPAAVGFANGDKKVPFFAECTLPTLGGWRVDSGSYG